MTETIEAFVSRLQTEGVEAGKQAAEEIRAEARRQAEQIVRQARQEAEKVLAQARAEADSAAERSRSELELAARDTVFRLRDSLNRAVQAVLAQAVKPHLDNADFLARLLHDLVLQYAQADFERRGGRININVPPEMRQKLVDWALHELGQDKSESVHRAIDLKGTLKEAGFEYEVSGSTVEVTVDSVVSTLSEMVSPTVRELLEKAVADVNAGAGA